MIYIGIDWLIMEPNFRTHSFNYHNSQFHAVSERMTVSYAGVPPDGLSNYEYCSDECLLIDAAQLSLFPAGTRACYTYVAEARFPGLPHSVLKVNPAHLIRMNKQHWCSVKLDPTQSLFDFFETGDTETQFVTVFTLREKRDEFYEMEELEEIIRGVRE